MHDSSTIRERILRGGDTPERRAVFDRFFAAGPPRKLRRAASRFDLENVRVLDVGCGHGLYLVQFSSQSLGLDRSKERVAFARSIGLNAELRDVERDEWNAELLGFDVVWLCDILVHVAEPGALLEQLHTVLAPSGKLVITEWLWPKSSLLARLLAGCVPGGREVLVNAAHLHRFSRQSLAELLSNAGFEIVESYNHSFANPVLVSITDSFWPPRTIVARSRQR